MSFSKTLQLPAFRPRDEVSRMNRPSRARERSFAEKQLALLLSFLEYDKPVAPHHLTKQPRIVFHSIAFHHIVSQHHIQRQASFVLSAVQYKKVLTLGKCGT